MNELLDRIDQLDDAAAVKALRIAVAGLDPTPASQSDVRDLVASEPDSAEPVTPSEGNLARQSLRLLAADPAHAKAIARLADPHNPPPQSFVIEGAIAMVTAALVVLNTSIKFKRDTKGKISFEFKIAPATEALRKDVIGLCRTMLGLPPE